MLDHVEAIMSRDRLLPDLRDEAMRAAGFFGVAELIRPLHKQGRHDERKVLKEVFFVMKRCDWEGKGRR